LSFSPTLLCTASFVFGSGASYCTAIGFNPSSLLHSP
jgi:hypothetical protein